MHYTIISSSKKNDKIQCKSNCKKIKLDGCKKVVCYIRRNQFNKLAINRAFIDGCSVSLTVMLVCCFLSFFSHKGTYMLFFYKILSFLSFSVHDNCSESERKWGNLLTYLCFLSGKYSTEDLTGEGLTFRGK